jgi:CheY-like chemotaxis protein
MMMPQMDGLELVRRLRARPDVSDLAIVMLSSAASPGQTAHFESLGVARYIMKPVTQSMLFNAIASALGVARADQGPDASLTAGLGESFTPRRILLAEDGVVNRKVAVLLLEQRGHRVTEVENGQLAVDAFRQGQFDLILLDVQMPVLDGFAAAAAIRKIEAAAGGRIPIIAMTAHAMKGDRERCLEAGMDGYVSKPFRPQELFAEVERTQPPRETADHGSAGDATARQNGAAESAEATSGPMPCDLPRAFCLEDALKNLGGSREMLAEMIELFAVEGPKQLADIQAAYDAGDPEAVMRAAHLFKGSASLFGASAATAAAQRIEQLGRDRTLGAFPEAWADLQQRVADLRWELARVKSAPA